MQVTSTTQTQSTATSSTAPTTNALAPDENQFLKLFMAQMENQDPLNPQDGSAMVAQLAQFSTLEQATETNTHLTDLVTGETSSANASLAGLVGRDCNAVAGSFTLNRTGSETAIPPIELSSASAMNGATVQISDSNGKVLQTLAVPNGATQAQIQWNGLAADGSTVPNGSYTISVTPGTTAGSISSQWQGRVDSVEMSNGTTSLRMGGVLVSPNTIQTIGMTDPLTAATAAAAATKTTTTGAAAAASPQITTATLANPGATL
jgi:flagellar basal-body rod modification protein FlgD